MQIIRNKHVVEDVWTTLNERAPLPEEGDIIVPLERWREERAALKSHRGRIGVQLASTDDVWTLKEGLDALSLVVVSFPKYADGRGYSQAWILRSHLNFSGDVRAVGDVLRDQLHHMSRCGINEFVLRADKDISDALKAFATYGFSYQPSLA